MEGESSEGGVRTQGTHVIPIYIQGTPATQVKRGRERACSVLIDEKVSAISANPTYEHISIKLK